MTVRFRRRSLIALLSATGLSGVASAQDISAPTADRGEVQEIVVTAERRSANLQDVPVSVGVLAGEDLHTFASGGDDTLLALSGRVPSRYAETTTGRIFPLLHSRAWQHRHLSWRVAAGVDHPGRYRAGACRA